MVKAVSTVDHRSKTHVNHMRLAGNLTAWPTSTNACHIVRVAVQGASDEATFIPVGISPRTVFRGLIPVRGAYVYVFGRLRTNRHGLLVEADLLSVMAHPRPLTDDEPIVIIDDGS